MYVSRQLGIVGFRLEWPGHQGIAVTLSNGYVGNKMGRKRGGPTGIPGSL